MLTIHFFMKQKYALLREKAISLRRSGMTYNRIATETGYPIPKSTLSDWCKMIALPLGFKRNLNGYNRFNLDKARGVALAVNRNKREKYLLSIKNRISHLQSRIKDEDVAKIALAMLYLGEGSKTEGKTLSFGNSDPFIISAFLYLLRYCYKIDEKKFRLTVQCRADQDTDDLEAYWQRVTGISKLQTYKSRIDPRTLGKPTTKKEYKGVCRIDYYCSDIFIELMQIPKEIFKGP